MKDRCPPHRFTAAWASSEDNIGVIYCKWCGDVTPLTLRAIEPPDEEIIRSKGELTTAEMEQLRRDYGEPT